MPEINLANGLSTLNAANSNALSGLSGSKIGEGRDTSLDQSDFIQLLVAQVKNQDPSKPLEPSQFMNQLAQFSTVNGIQDLNTSFNSLAGQLTSDQALQAAGLVGRSVLVGGGEARLEAGGGVKGVVNLDEASTDVVLKVVNVQGVEVRSMNLGGAEAGELAFHWDGFEDDGSAAAPGTYQLKVEALVGGERIAKEVAIEKQVSSVTLGQDNAATTLNLADGNRVALNRIQAIR